VAADVSRLKPLGLSRRSPALLGPFGGTQADSPQRNAAKE